MGRPPPRRHGRTSIARVDGVHRASGHERVARRLADQGRWREALIQAKAAAGMYRQLAHANPEAYLPDLARCLAEVGMLQTEVAWERALAPVREATEIYRRLTRTAPRALPDLAGRLSTVLTFLSEMGSCIGPTGSPGPEADVEAFTGLRRLGERSHRERGTEPPPTGSPDIRGDREAR